MFVVQPEQGYREPISLWMVCALPPGNRKTAVLKEMLAPLIAFERKQVELLAPEIRRAKSRRESQEARISELRKKAAKATVEDYRRLEQQIADMGERLMEVPPDPRLVAQDITPEYLGELMAAQGERMAIVSDEGGIFETIAGRYSAGIPNLDLFLQSHSGSLVRVDRRSRPPILLEEPALTLGLSPQPDVLRGLSSKEGFRGRGLLARFLYTLPKSRVGFRTHRQRPVPTNVRDEYYTLFRELLNIQPAKDEHGAQRSYILELTNEAFSVWKDFQIKIEATMRPGGCFEHINDWSAKLPGAALRLAAVLHCAEHANSQPWSLEISHETMIRALMLADTFSTHALIVFDLIGMDDEIGAARKVWTWIETKRASEFTTRECYRDLRGTFRKVEMLIPPLTLLQERSYIEKQPDTKTGQGRKKDIWRVNPSLVAQWDR